MNEYPCFEWMIIVFIDVFLEYCEIESSFYVKIKAVC